MRAFTFVAAIGTLLIVGSSLQAQCRGGAAGQGTTGGTTTTASLAGTGVAGTTGVASGQLLTGPGSFAYDIMRMQMIQQQIAQQQYQLALRKEAAYQEKLAARKYRAEQTRAQVAESRARTRAALAAQNGLKLDKKSDRNLVAYQSLRR